MANSSPDSDEDQVDAHAHKVERFVIAGAIIGPLLLGLLAWMRQSDWVDPWNFRPAATTLLRHVEWMITLGLTVWLAWRHPILGGKIIRSLVVATVIVLAIGAVQYWQTIAYSMDETTYVMNQTIRVVTFTAEVMSFLIGLAFMVLARRLFHIALVKRGEPDDYCPSRLSIRELMLWTLVIAGIMGFYLHLMRWIENTGVAMVSVPGWFSAYYIVAEHVPTTLLVLAIVYCQRSPMRRWLGVVLVLYLTIKFADAMIQQYVYGIYFDMFPAGWRSHVYAMIDQTIFAMITVFVIWMFRKLGYRFQRNTG